MDEWKIRRITEKLGLPYPECENERRILLEIACEKVDLPIPECENEEDILYREIEEYEDD